MPGDGGAPPTIRAIWTPDRDGLSQVPPYTTSLNANDRRRIVILSADVSYSAIYSR